MSDETNAPESKPLSSFERIEKLEKGVDRALKSAMNIDGMAQNLVQNVMSLEQSYASLAKTLAAVIGELESTKVLDGAAVMRRIRESDEASDRQRVKDMLDQNIIRASEVVANSSLVVVKQAALEVGPQGSRTVPITDYRTLEMPSIFVPEETRKLLLDKRVGDTVEVKRDARNGITTVLTATVIEVYELVEGERGSEA